MAENKEDHVFEKQDHDIDAEIYGSSEKIQEIERVNDLKNKISSVTRKYTNVAGKNIIELMSSLEINNKNKSNNYRGNFNGKNKEEIKKSIEDKLVENINSTYFTDERQRFLRYEDYRLIDAYIPELAKCLDLFRDAILSPDDVTKQSLNYSYDSDIASETVIKNIENLIAIYNLNKEVKEDIREALKLGDLFTIILNVGEEISKFLKEDERHNDLLPGDIDPQDDGIKIMNESQLDINDYVITQLVTDDTSLLREDKRYKEKLKNNIETTKKDIIDSINNNIKFCKNPMDLISENNGEKEVKGKNKSIKLNGSILKVPKPENIIKIEIDKNCIGYIYIEKTGDDQASNLTHSTSVRNVSPLQNGTNDMFNVRYDFLKDNSTKNLEGKYKALSDIFINGISKKIDIPFIKKNKDLKNVIYSLIKEDYILNKQVSMTFLQPEQVFHFKLDSNNTYGISKLAKSLFVSKIYLATLITNMLQKISRGRDKRAYYVDVGMDDDMEGTVEAFIRDIKSKEITSDNLNSVTTLLNSIGAFEDYFIPTMDGNKPVEIDTVQGMDIDVDNDFLNNLLKSAVSGTGVPESYIDETHNVEFARTLAMQNQAFVRSIVCYQSDFSEYYSKIMQKLYYNEYMINDETNNVNLSIHNKKKNRDSTIDLNDIKVKFNPPIYLNLTSTNDQISNASTTIDFIISVYINDEDEDAVVKKLEFKKALAEQYFLPTMDWESFNRIYEENKINDIKKKVNTNAVNIVKSSVDEDEELSDEDLEDDDL